MNSSFGILPDGRRVQMLTIGGGDRLLLEILDYGAILHRVQVPAPSGDIDVLLRHESLDGYLHDRAYINAAIGRYANRIAEGAFTVEGRHYQASLNEGRNMLHGGTVGFGRQLWSLVEADADRVVLGLKSPDGDDGFPGELDVRVIFALVEDDAFSITFEATTDRPTPVNLTQHLYFNLTGCPDQSIHDHTLQVAAKAILPVRSDLIPTGAIEPVIGGCFDLRHMRSIGDILVAGDPLLKIAEGIDFNWVLEESAPVKARLFSPESGLRLDLATNQPGLQVYSGQKLSTPFGPWSGIALEPQNFPDAPNQAAFPNTILRPGELYRNESLYSFKRL